MTLIQKTGFTSRGTLVEIAIALAVLLTSLGAMQYKMATGAIFRGLATL